MLWAKVRFVLQRDHRRGPSRVNACLGRKTSAVNSRTAYAMHYDEQQSDESDGVNISAFKLVVLGILMAQRF